MTYPTSLPALATALRNDQIDLHSYLDDICQRLDELNPVVQAFLPEPDRHIRLQAEAAALQSRFPDPSTRPALYGIPVGIKDVFPVDGFPTRAGSQLPPELFAAPEAACVTMLRAAGALILGKTVTTEFAYFEPGPTRNPLQLDHTPGGSSSGSAAAIAAGLCPLAIGTQTIGSTIRPAAFCGIVGFKPTFGRIPRSGLILCSESLDHVGYFAQDVAGIKLVAPLLCRNWQPANPSSPPVLGVPVGPYLDQVSAEAREVFEGQLVSLQIAGYTVCRVPALEDFDAIYHRHQRLVFAEMAHLHAAWFAQYAPLYRPRTATAIREGETISSQEAAQARAGQIELRTALEGLMAREGLDLWVCPSAPGPAPEGLEATGSPVMNAPWTYTGMPAITVPAGRASNGLPLGFQCIARVHADEYLLAWAEPLAATLAAL